MHITTRFIIGLLLFSVVACTNKKTSSHNSNNDSINKYLPLASSQDLPFPKKDYYNKKALSFVDLNKNDTLTRYYLGKISYNFLKTNNNSYKKVSDLHFNKSISTNDTLNLARFYRYKASSYRRNQSLDSSYYYFLKSEKFYMKTNDKLGLAFVYYCKALIQEELNDYLAANFYATQSYAIIKNRIPNNLNYDVLNLLGNISHDLKEYNKAIEYHIKALNLAKKNKYKSYYFKFNFLSSSLNNIGNSYRECKDFKNAIYYFKEALKNKNLIIEDPESYAQLLNNLGYCELETNNHENLPLYFEKALKIFNNLGIKDEAAIANMYLSNYYFKINDTVKAIDYSNIAMKLAKESKSTYYYLTVLSNAGTINKNKANEYIKEYHQLNDSLLFEERKTRNQFHKIQLETDEITQQKEFAVKQNGKTMLIMTGILCIVILLFVIYRQNTKQKELKLLQSQQKANEELYQLLLNQQNKEEEIRVTEKKRIAQELHDGVMNRLAGTRINLFILTRNRDEETINKCIGYIQDIHAIENEIRNIAHDLNNDFFNDSNSFINLVDNFIKELNNSHTTHFELQIEPDINWDTIQNHIKMHCYRILQEAALNCVKHAQASQVTVSMLQDGTNICMSISDNGKGFDTNSVKYGMGLKNIHKRIQSLHGLCSIQSSANGTSINLALPLK